MTTRDGTHLRLVPEDTTGFAGNRVQDLAAAPAPEPVAPPVARGRDARVLVPVVLASTLVLALLGSQPWQLPHRDGDGLTGVPQSLLAFLLLCAAGCTLLAGRLVQPGRTFRSTGGATTWWAVVAGAAVVSVAADLSLASYAGSTALPGDLPVRCAVLVVPALLAGLLAREEGRAARIRAALGTGVLTLPMAALGWALLASSASSPAGSTDALAMTLTADLAPFALAVAFVAAGRRTR